MKRYQLIIHFYKERGGDFCITPCLIFNKAQQELDVIEKGYGLWLNWLWFGVGLCLYKER